MKVFDHKKIQIPCTGQKFQVDNFCNNTGIMTHCELFMFNFSSKSKLLVKIRSMVKI